MFASAEAGSSRFPMDTAAYLSPMEKMMLAKAALMEEEERERAAKRERRWSRRQTTLELNTPGGSARSSIISLQSNNSLDSISPRGKLPSASILRKPSTSSVSSADSYPAAPSRSGRSASSSLVVGRYTDYGPSFRSLSTDGSTSPSRRRSSKVRFDDEPVSPAPTSLNLAWGTPTSNYSALSSPESRGDNGLYSPSPLHLAKSEHRLSTSSITGLRDDILRTSKALGSALISRSGPSSVSGDDLDLELMPMSRLSIPEIRMEGGEEREDFKSLPLPYPKMSKRLSQLSIAESLSEDNRRLSFEGSICNPSDDERLQPSRVPSISDRSDCSFYAAAPMSSLRAALRNPSLGSMASCDGNSALSYAPSVRASIGSIASTIFSSVSVDGADSLASRSDFGDAEEFNTAKPAFTATFEAQDSAYSSLLPSAAPTPKQSSVTAFSTLSDDEGSIAETPIQSMNRAPWGEDMGLSPRSGPSPIIDENPPMVPPQLAPPSPELLAEEMPVFEEQAEVALPASPSLSVPPLTNDSAVSSSSLKGLGVYNTPDHLITPFKLINPFEHMALEPKVLKPLLASAMLRVAHSDSIDMLPGDLHLRSQSAASSVNGQGASAHRRTDSAVSVGDMLSFPVPPSRQHTPPPTVMPATRRVGVTSFSALQRTPPTQVVDEIHNSPTLTEDEETTPTPGSKNAGTVPVNEISLDTPVADQITTMNSPLTPPPFAERRYTGRSSPRLDETIKRSPSKKANSIDDDSELEIDADSDLDISQPLVRAAIQSKILSPNTSLNKEPSPKRRPALLRSGSTSPTDLRPGMSCTKNLGWSGSESEEEGFVSAIRDITLKKLSGESSTSPRRRYKVKLARSTSANNSPPSRSGSSDLSSPLTVRKSKSASRINVGSPTPTHPVLESRKSTASRASSSDSNGPITPHAVDDVTEAVMVVVEVSSHQSRPSTPSASSPGGSGSKATTGMGISMPGKFPWGGSAPSSPTGSIRSVRSNPINGANANGLSGTGRDIESFFDAIKVNQKRSSSSGRKIPTLARKIDLAAGSFLRSNPLVRSASGNSGLPRSNRFNPDRPTPSLRSLKLRGSTMPPPKMLIKGWGAPEVLVGEEWPMVMDSSDSEDDLPVMRGHSKGKKAISALAPWEAQGLKERKERSTPPTQADEWGSLLEEGMPEIGTAH